MAEEMHHLPETDMLPMRQRLAWIAAIWAFSVATMVLISLAVRALIA